MTAQMFEHGWQYRQQHHVHVVKTGGAPGDGALHVAEAADLQVVYRLL